MRSNRQLRIAFYDPSGGGGISHYTFQLANSLAAAGCDVVMITTESYELNHLPRHFEILPLFKSSRLKAALLSLLAKIQGKSSAVRRRVVQKWTGENHSSLLSRFFFLEMVKSVRLRVRLLQAVVFLSRYQPDVIHFQWLIDRRADYYLIKSLRWLGFKVVYTVHDLLPHDEHTVENQETFKKIYELADKLIVHAERNKGEMIRIFAINPNKICVIPHGSNDIFFDQKVISTGLARQHLGIPAGKKVVLFFGLIKRYKGLDYLIKAFEEVKDQIKDAMLLIAGKVYAGDAEVFSYYTTLLSQFRGRTDVMCVQDYIPFAEVGYYFSAADIVVLPYVEASQSGVLLSALAAGKPVVASETGGLSEVVENDRNGFIVPPTDTKALAEALIKIFKTPGCLEQMSKHSRTLAETTYSWEGIASKTIEVYRSVHSLV